MITKEQRDRLRALTQKSRNRDDVLVPAGQLIGILDALDQLESNQADMLLWANAVVEGIKKHMPHASFESPEECTGCGHPFSPRWAACAPDCVWTLIDNIGKAVETLKVITTYKV